MTFAAAPGSRPS